MQPTINTGQADPSSHKVQFRITVSIKLMRETIIQWPSGQRVADIHCGGRSTFTCIAWVDSVHYPPRGGVMSTSLLAGSAIIVVVPVQ